LAEDSWQRTLARIPSVLGRLAYLASLRNPNTGNYVHFGLAQRAGAAEVDRIARRSHSSIFQQWLSFDLRSQKDDLDTYLVGQEGDRKVVVEAWSDVQPFSAWIPADTRDVERALFESDLAIILAMLRTECGVALRDPDS
jgi:hypothetical protein